MTKKKQQKTTKNNKKTTKKLKRYLVMYIPYDHKGRISRTYQGMDPNR